MRTKRALKPFEAGVVPLVKVLGEGRGEGLLVCFTGTLGCV